MDNRELLIQMERISVRDRDKLARYVDTRFNHLERKVNQLDDVIASATAKVAALTTEVANANAKTDAALAALQASVTSGAPVTQAQIDAIAAIGTSADAATGALQTEEAKVDAGLTPAATADGGGGPGEEQKPV